MVEMIDSGVLEDNYARTKEARTKRFRELEQEITSPDTAVREAALAEIESLYPAQTIPGFLDWLQENYSDLPAVREARYERESESSSYEEFTRRVEELSETLLTWGVQKGNRIGMLTENSPEQLVFNFAVQNVGAIVVPWTEDAKKNGGLSHFEIMEQAEVDFVALSESKFLSSFPDNSIPVLPITEAMEQALEEEERMPIETTEHESLADVQETIDPIDPALMMFSSGTGGGSLKLVELSHKNLMYITLAALEKSDMHPEDKILEVLPWHHIYQYATQYIALATGQELSVSTALDMQKSKLKILEEIAPDHMTAVPLVWEKISKQVNDNIVLKEKAASGIKKFVLEGAQKALEFDSAKAVMQDLERNKGTDFEPQSKEYWKPQMEVAGETLGKFKGVMNKIQIQVGRSLGYPSIKKQMGLDNMHYVVNGGGTLSPGTAAWYQALGVNMKIGYGMTESGAMTTFGNPDKYESPFVAGETLPGVRLETRTDEVGFDIIWIAGPMLGKYVDEELNKDAFDERGFYCTGDIGKVQNNEDGTQSLIIEGRKKSMIKLKGGEAVLPEPIEAAMKNSEAIEDAFVHGTEESSQLKACFVVSWEHLYEKFNNLTKDKFEQSQEVLDYIKDEIRRLAPMETFGAVIGEFYLRLEGFPEEVMSRSNKVIRPKLAALVLPV